MTSKMKKIDKPFKRVHAFKGFTSKNVYVTPDAAGGIHKVNYNTKTFTKWRSWVNNYYIENAGVTTK